MKYSIVILALCTSVGYAATLENVPYRQWYESRSHVHKTLGKPDDVVSMACERGFMTVAAPQLSCEVDVWNIGDMTMHASYNAKNELIYIQYRHVPYLWTESDKYTVLEPYNDVINESSKEWRKSLIPKRFKTWEEWWNN